MLQLKRGLNILYQQRTRNCLAYTSLGRFDQQETTKPHRDGGPDESLLMLGYEPTTVRSCLRMADYTQCAYDLGITPQQFLTDHNPMYADGERMLNGYTTELDGLDPTNHQILLINNSCVPYREGKPALLGVLHQAIIENPTSRFQRIVNSTMMTSVATGSPESVTAEEQEEFLRTDRISRRV